jgi:hypothetical protein
LQTHRKFTIAITNFNNKLCTTTARFLRIHLKMIELKSSSIFILVSISLSIVQNIEAIEMTQSGYYHLPHPPSTAFRRQLNNNIPHHNPNNPQDFFENPYLHPQQQQHSQAIQRNPYPNPNLFNHIPHNSQQSQQQLSSYNQGLLGLKPHSPSMIPAMLSSTFNPPPPSPAQMQSLFLPLDLDKQVQLQQQQNQGRSHDASPSMLNQLTQDLRREHLMKSIKNADPAILKRLDLATRPREARRGIVEDLDMEQNMVGPQPSAQPFVTYSGGNKSSVSQTSSSPPSSQKFIGSQFQPDDVSKINPSPQRGEDADMENGWRGLSTPTMSYFNHSLVAPNKTYSAVRSPNSAADQFEQRVLKTKAVNMKRSTKMKNASKKLKALNARIRSNSGSLNSSTSFASKLKHVLDASKTRTRQMNAPKISINKVSSQSHIKISKSKPVTNEIEKQKKSLKKHNSRFPLKNSREKTFPLGTAIRSKLNLSITTATSTTTTFPPTVVSDAVVSEIPSKSLAITEILPTNSSYLSTSSKNSSSSTFHPSPTITISENNEIIIGSSSAVPLPPRALEQNNSQTVSTSMSFSSSQGSSSSSSSSQSQFINTNAPNRSAKLMPVTQPSSNPMFVALKNAEKNNEVLEFNPSTNMLTSTSQSHSSSIDQNNLQRHIFQDNLASESLTQSSSSLTTAPVAAQNIYPTPYYQQANSYRFHHPHHQQQQIQNFASYPRFQNTWGFNGNHNPFGYYSHGGAETGRMAPPKIRFFSIGNNKEQDDSEEDEHTDIRDTFPPIVDPHHPVVQNALHPLGNPSKEPEQYIKLVILKCSISISFYRNECELNFFLRANLNTLFQEKDESDRSIILGSIEQNSCLHRLSPFLDSGSDSRVCLPCSSW